MASVSFKKGLVANLPNTYTEGTLYITTDERGLYLDVSDSARIRLGDFQEFATVAALEANANPSTTALYYVSAINCLAKWDGSHYVQINLDTGATSVEVTGTGNAITGASYDATSRKITFTKGETYMTSSDVDDKLSALDLSDTYYSKSLGEANAAAITGIKDGTTIDSFADVETALDGKQDTIPANTYDAYGTAADVLGSSGDASTANTVYGAKALANAKVASVTAGDDSMTVGGTATAPTVAVQLDPSEGNNLVLVSGKGLRVDVPSAAEYTIAKLTTAEDGYAASYKLTKDGTQVGATINIPKDMVVESGTVETKSAAGVWGEAGTYLHLVLANTTEDDIYINVTDLIEYVTSGSSVGDMVVITVDANHRVTASITDGTITLAKLHTDVQTEIGKAHTHSNKAVLDGITAAKITSWDDEVGAMAAVTAIKDGATIDSFGDVESALADMQTELTFDTTPTDGSSNPVTSDGVYDALGYKAPLASPDLTGTPTAPTAAAGTNTTQIATTAFVQTALAWGSF